VHFVDNVDFIAAGDGQEPDPFAEFANFVDPRLEAPSISRTSRENAFRDFPAVRAGVAGYIRRTLFTVDGLGQNAGDGGLSHTPRSAEEEGVGNAVLADGIFQGLDHVRLPHHVLEDLGPPFPG
jgi:hypothetical protein